jgi:hypothetical protein
MFLPNRIHKCACLVYLLVALLHSFVGHTQCQMVRELNRQSNSQKVIYWWKCEVLDCMNVGHTLNACPKSLDACYFTISIVVLMFD